MVIIIYFICQLNYLRFFSSLFRLAGVMSYETEAHLVVNFQLSHDTPGSLCSQLFLPRQVESLYFSARVPPTLIVPPPPLIA